MGPRLRMLLGACVMLVTSGSTNADIMDNPWSKAFDRIVTDVQNRSPYMTRVRPEDSRWHDLIHDQASLRQALGWTFTTSRSNVRLLTAEEAEQWKLRTNVSYFGIGVTLGTVRLSDAAGIVITDVEEGTAAESAHLRKGDQIVFINGQDIRGKTEGELRALLNQKKPGATTLTMLKSVPGSQGQFKEPSAITLEPDIDGSLGIKFDIAGGHNFPVVKHLNGGDTPAIKAGLQVNDIILSFRDKSLEDADLSSFTTTLRQERKPLSLEVLRDGMVQTVYLTPGLIPAWYNATDYTARHGSGPANDASNSWSRLTIKHMDWDVDWMYQSVLGEIEYGNQYAALTLDLSGADGNNTDAAARILFRFIDDGTLFAVERGTGENKVLVTYVVENGVLEKRESGAVNATSILETPVQHFHKKLLVKVDAGTNGAAAAIAYAVQAHHAGLIVGTFPFLAPHDRQTITDVVSEASEDGDILVSIPGVKLLNEKGLWSTPFSLDRWLIDGSVKEQARVANGTPVWLRDDFVVYGLAGILSLALIFFIDRQSKKSSRADKTVAVQATAAPVIVKQSPPSRKLPTWQRVLLGVAMVAVLPAMYGVLWLSLGPPLGTRAVMTVQFYGDGGSDSQREADVVSQLKHELHGDIVFETIDLKQHPELLSKDHQWSNTAVPSAPAIRLRLDWLDRQGKKLNPDWYGGGFAHLTSKRMLLEMIRGDAQMIGKDFWPHPTITRTAP